jgi:hypothetical protein
MPAVTFSLRIQPTGLRGRRRATTHPNWWARIESAMAAVGNGNASTPGADAVAGEAKRK